MLKEYDFEGCFCSFALFASSHNMHQFCAEKQFFVLIMENLILFTREVTVFREVFFFFNVAVSYHYLTVSYQTKHLELRVNSWLAQ